ncbi:MAG: serine/threonine protein kinase, partial [Deltaproteobacteria bacterium]
MASRDNARRFHFLREIATGGFGTVWLCKVLHADGFTRVAAVKLLKAQWTDSEEIVRRIRDEARLLGLLRHRAIITVYDLTSIDGRAAVVMEYVEGVDLRTVIRALRNRDETMPVRAVLDIAATVAGALDAAYNQPPMPGDKPLRVIHRDIKPSNIMVDVHGEVKVLDFGVARSDIENRESHTEELQFGSVDYMAPERLFFEPETPAGDIYALGATIFELLAREKLGKAKGRPPQHTAEVEDRLSFLRANLRVRSTVATELVDLLRSCLRYEHEERPTAAELQQRCRALGRLVEDEELQPWAERVIPPLHAAAAAAPRRPNPMSDSIRREDSVSFSTGRTPSEDAGEDLGNRLRQGVLRELDDSTGRVRPGGAGAGPLFAGTPKDALLVPEPPPAARAGRVSPDAGRRTPPAEGGVAT